MCYNFSFEVSIRPPTAELIADFILYKQWTEIVYMHDGKNCECLHSVTSL